MHIKTLRIRNFRRLKDVRIDLDTDLSIFVGANNSGKTSASQALQLFMGASRKRFSIYDFNAESWALMNAFGDGVDDATPPVISLDIWFHVDAQDLHRVIDLLPSLAWEGNLVGLRIEFAPIDAATLLSNFNEARERARANIPERANGENDYHPEPRTLHDYLTKNLQREYEFRYHVLDYTQFDQNMIEVPGYVPLPLLPDKGKSGKDILSSLLLVDVLYAQRHLTDAEASNRTEDLSRCLSRFYIRNLEKRGEDFDTIRALADSEAMLNDHLQRVFEPTLRRLSTLGYPGLSNPQLLIKSAINPATIMSSYDGARVHYALGNPEEEVDPPTLPDRYNGLGFKHLIYMVVELLDCHAQWMDIEDNRPPLHLIFIEEPEAHLHAQLQQVFIREVLNILMIEGEEQAFYSSQIVVTTHSSHILYERGFQPIRYFRRCSTAVTQYSDVLNLSAFYAETANPTRDFLERYLKLTHCDLFFADAAVLVEGNVERLLLPQMIAKVAPQLQSTYLSILEIGGAFGHRFRTLIEFLGITALIITDIDSVRAHEEEELGDQEENGAGSTCMVHVENAITSNQTLIQWLPSCSTISELLDATDDQRTQLRVEDGQALVRVTYQTLIDVDWNEEQRSIAGRTLEEAFALENLDWCQNEASRDLKLHIRDSADLTIEQLAEHLHNRIKGSSFNKTDFALALLAEDPESWTVPQYITEGLRWLENEINPVQPQVEEEGGAVV